MHHLQPIVMLDLPIQHLFLHLFCVSLPPLLEGLEDDKLTLFLTNNRRYYAFTFVLDHVEVQGLQNLLLEFYVVLGAADVFLQLVVNRFGCYLEP